MDTQLGARHRWGTPTSHRGSAERTIAVRPTGGLRVTRQRSEAGRHAIADDERVRRPCPNQRSKSERKESTPQPQLCSMPASPAFRLRSVLPPCPPHQSVELVEVDGLDGVIVEACLARALECVFLAEAGDGNDDHGVELGPGPEPAGDLEATDDGHPEIEQDEVGPELVRHGERRGTVEGRPDLVALAPEQARRPMPPRRTRETAAAGSNP